MLAQQVSGKIISPLYPTTSDIQAPFNWAIHTVVEVLSLVVSVEGLLGLESAGPKAIGCLAGKLASSAGMRAAVGGAEYKLVLCTIVPGGGIVEGEEVLTCCRSTCGIRRI